MAFRRLVRAVVRDQASVGQPLDGVPPGTSIAEREPTFTKLGILEERALEASERTSAFDRPLQEVSGPSVGHPTDEVLHVLVADRRRQWGDEDKTGLVEVVGRLLVHVGAVEPHLPSGRIEPPGVTVGRLGRMIVERLSEIVEVEATAQTTVADGGRSWVKVA